MVDLEVNTLTKAIFANIACSLLQKETVKQQAEIVTGGSQP